MAALIGPLDVEATRARLREARGRIDDAARRAGRDPAAIELLVATKYLAPEELPKLAEAGGRLVGENRAQDLAAKASVFGELFRFDFIGRLQSRKVRAILPHVRIIHSLASESALRELTRWRELARPDARVLIEVSVSGEQEKAGVAPGEIASYVERCPLPLAGLMTMPPHATEPEQSRPWFAELRALAAEHGLTELSMGTSQDYEVAVEEGATIVRLGRTVIATS